MMEPNNLAPSGLMCTAIGMFSISWSQMEMAMDFWVLLVFHHFGGKQLRRNCPKPISAKLEHIRQVIEKSESFAPWARRATELLDSVDGLVNNRHNLIHGALYASGLANS